MCYHSRGAISRDATKESLGGSMAAGSTADGAVAPVFGQPRAARAAGSGPPPTLAPFEDADEEQQEGEKKEHALFERSEQAEAAQSTAPTAITLIVVGEYRQGRGGQGQGNEETFHRHSPERPQKGQKRWPRVCRRPQPGQTSRNRVRQWGQISLGWSGRGSSLPV